MSVAAILQALAENAGAAQLRRGAIYGNLVQSASQVPEQIAQDRERASSVALHQSQVQQQMRLEEARAQREEQLARHQDTADQHAALTEQHLGAIVGAGFQADPTKFDIGSAVSKAQELGRPDLIPTVAAVHDKFTKPPIKGSAGDVFFSPDTHQPIEGMSVPEKQTPEQRRLFLGTKQDTGVALTPEETAFIGEYDKLHPKTPGPVHDTPDGLVRVNPDNTTTPLGVSGYHPPPQAGAAGGDGLLSPDAIEYEATIHRVTGKPVPTRLNEHDKTAILNAAASQAKTLGQTPAQSLQKQAAYAGDAKAMQKMQSMSAAAESFENKALGQADIIAGLSQKVGRTGSPMLNSWLLAGKDHVLGDSDTHQLYNAVSTFAAEYAKIMEGSTGSAAGSSDSARKAADRLISANLSKGTMADTLALMKKEMALTIGGYGATIEHITERMGGQPSAPPAAAPTGTTYKLVNGQWVKQ